MRSEAKHKDSFKHLKNRNKSRAKKHQTAKAYHWETFTVKQNECGQSKELLSTSRVKVDRLEFKAGLVVCSLVSFFLFSFDKLLRENFADHGHAFRIVQSEEGRMIENILHFTNHLIFKARPMVPVKLCILYLHLQCFDSAVLMTAGTAKHTLLFEN